MRKIHSLTEAVPEALMCRTEGHAYRWVTDRVTMDRTGKRVVEFDRIKECTRCFAVQTKTINARTWTVVKRKVVYPDGYLIAGRGRVPSADVYREQYSRPEFFE